MASCRPKSRPRPNQLRPISPVTGSGGRAYASCRNPPASGMVRRWTKTKVLTLLLWATCQRITILRTRARRLELAACASQWHFTNTPLQARNVFNAPSASTPRTGRTIWSAILERCTRIAGSCFSAAIWCSEARLHFGNTSSCCTGRGTGATSAAGVSAARRSSSDTSSHMKGRIRTWSKAIEWNPRVDQCISTEGRTRHVGATVQRRTNLA